MSFKSGFERQESCNLTPQVAVSSKLVLRIIVSDVPVKIKP